MTLNKRLFLGLGLPLIIALGFCNNVNKDKESTLVKNVLTIMQAQHYSPVENGDTFSNRVFTLFINQLDERNLFFTAADHLDFEKYRYAIDEETKNNTFQSFNHILKTYKIRIDQVEIYSLDAFKDVTKCYDKSFEVPSEEKPAAKNEKELKDYWTKYSAYLVIDNWARKGIAQDKQAKSDSFKPISQDSMEAKAIAEELKDLKAWFKRLKRLSDEDYFHMFVNCMTMAYDPHSNYYPPRQKEDFDIALSGQFEGIGASLSERDGFIKVENIIPGSASYRQGVLKNGDLITAVAQGEEKAVKVIDMPLSEVVQLIRGVKGTTVKLTVQKPDGAISVIPIVRDVVVLEEGYAKSAIFNMDGKYGYINLPSFYADFNKRQGRSSAKDMEEEVTKMVGERIDGLVIDLRYNGGGSLQDVVDMLGLFTGSGPAVQIKSKGNANDVYPTRRPRALYQGPLVVLVNYNSASASEILAAALQDYKRAVIIGTKNTFGKGTVQRFVDLSDFFPDMEKSGSVKFTTQKFYRVNGETTQFNGVIPDVIIPDRFDYTEIGEKELPYALKGDKLSNVLTNVLPTQNYLAAISGGNASVLSNTLLQNQKEIAKQLNERSDISIFKINITEYKAYLTELEQQMNSLDSIKADYNMKITLLPADRKQLAADSVKLEIREKWATGYKNDAYMYEAIKVLKALNQ